MIIMPYGWLTILKYFSLTIIKNSSHGSDWDLNEISCCTHSIYSNTSWAGVGCIVWFAEIWLKVN